ncbi:MAG: FeoC-like transcriptional regulator [Arenicellales bacterium]|nr:FeoC-like transcriptional regulator [Arenicellales bacterium]
MTLIKVGQYLKRRGHASLQDIALHVDAQTDAVQGMLETWIRRGQVRRSLTAAACSAGCSRCEQEASETHHWKDSPAEVADSGCPFGYD